MEKYIVAALTASLPDKYEQCMVVKENDVIIATHSKVFGPESKEECEKWMKEHCGENIQPANPATPVAPVAPVAPANNIVNAAPPSGGNQVGVFTTPQTLLTFSGATAAVSFILQVLTGVKVIAEENRGWWMLGLAFAVGLIIYIGTVSSGTTWRQKVLEIAVAVVNTFMIAAAVLGVDNFKSTTPSDPNKPANTNTNANKANAAAVIFHAPLEKGKYVSAVYDSDKNELFISN